MIKHLCFLCLAVSLWVSTNAAFASQEEKTIGGRSKEQIANVFEEQKVEIFRYYTEALNNKPGLAGKINFTISVLASGQTTGCTSDLDNEKLSALGATICEHILTMQFGAGQNTTFTYLINFFPGE